MTREQALWRVRLNEDSKEYQHAWHDTLVKNHNDIIEEIYNDFEARTCESCKYLKEDNNDSDIWIECRKKGTPMEYTSLISEKGYPNIIDFKCGHWEKQDD